MTTPSRDEAQTSDESVDDWRNGPSQRPRQLPHREQPGPAPHPPRRHRRRQQPPHRQEKITNAALEQQYRRAPLDGLIIGTIVGAFWILMTLGIYMFQTRGSEYYRENLASECSPYFVMSFVFPAVGWLTGSWERATVPYLEQRAVKQKFRWIGAAMAALCGTALLIISFVSGSIIKVYSFNQAPLIYLFYTIQVFVFTLVGWMLGDAQTSLRTSRKYVIPKMCLEMMSALIMSATLSMVVIYALVYLWWN